MIAILLILGIIAAFAACAVTLNLFDKPPRDGGFPSSRRKP